MAAASAVRSGTTGCDRRSPANRTAIEPALVSAPEFALGAAEGGAIRLRHDPEKHALGPRPDGWVPVFRKDHAQIKKTERDDDSKKSHRDMGGIRRPDWIGSIVRSALKFFRLAAAAMAIALASPAHAVTEIQWWHAMSGELGKQLERLAADFNGSQSEYRIVPSYKGNYTETVTASIFAFRSRSQPAIVQVNEIATDRKSTRLNSSHRCISYAVFCLKKK